MTSRPSMQARDSSGRKVSLLNDEPGNTLPPRSLSQSPYDCDMGRSTSYTSGRSSTSSPVTPGLSRADSFDSNLNDPLSPITPNSLIDFGRQSSYTSAGLKDQPYHYRERQLSYEEHASNGNYAMPIRPSYNDARTPSYSESHLYEDDSYQQSSERGPKRYPCRYKDSHNCQKTFTTSGHASRHSKIHTAEKGVSCTWEGCQKKFTRADNMKQHLETHTKERSRSQKTPIHNTPLKALTVPAGVKKPGPRPSPNSRPSSRNANPMILEIPPALDPALFVTTVQPPVTSFQAPNGLDTLAFAVDQTLRRG